MNPSNPTSAMGSLEANLPSLGDGVKTQLLEEREAYPVDGSTKTRAWKNLEDALGITGGSEGGSSAPTNYSGRGRIDIQKKRGRLVASLAGVVVLLCMGWSHEQHLPLLSTDYQAANIKAYRESTYSGEGELGALVDVNSLPSAPSNGKRRVSGFQKTKTLKQVPNGSREFACPICKERELLQAGREALQGKQYERTLALVTEHEALFPQGQLAEERESLRIHALIATGRKDDAQHAEENFHQNYPQSPLREFMSQTY